MNQVSWSEIDKDLSISFSFHTQVSYSFVTGQVVICCGLVVSVNTFRYDNLSSNSAADYHYNCAKMAWTEQKLTKKRPGMALYLNLIKLGPPLNTPLPTFLDIKNIWHLMVAVIA